MFWAGIFILCLPFLRVIRLFKKSRPMLIVYMGGIGDYLLLEHSMNLNSANLPEKIDLAYVPSRLKGIPELNPRIDRVFYLNSDIRRFFDLEQSTSATASFWKTIFHTSKQLFPLALSSYDQTITYGMSTNNRSYGEGINALIQSPETVLIGEDKHHAFSMSYSFDHNKESRWDIFGKAFFPSDGGEFNYTIESERPIQEKYIVIGPGGENLVVPRKWPSHHFQELVSELLNAFEGKLIIVGGPGDAEIGAKLKDIDRDRIIDLCAELSLMESMSYLRFAEFVVTNDSGVQHMSWRSGQMNTFVIYGSTDPNLLAPEGLGIHACHSRLDCMPCAGGIITPQTSPCSQNEEGLCLTQLTPKQLMERIKSELE